MHALGVSGGNMEGKEVRFGTGAFDRVGRIHDGCLQRLGQLHACLLHAARRTGAARADADRRGGARRRRLRPLRHRRAGHPGHVRRRPDGGPHAGISRQEAGGAGREDGDARHPDHAAVHLGLLGGVGGAAGGAGRSRQPRRRAGLPRSSMPTPRRPATTARPSRGSPPTRPGGTPRSASPCWPAASASSCR